MGKHYQIVPSKSMMHIDSPVRIITVIKLAATNDANGNPRRVWVLLNTTPNEVSPVTMSGNIITAIDEGYEGDAGVKRFINSVIEPYHTVLVVWGPTFSTTPAEYRATLKHNKGLKQTATPMQQQTRGGKAVR